MEMTSVRLAAIKPGGTNPRKHFDQAAQAELVESVKAHGVLQPVLLRPFPSKNLPAKGVAYELVAGERRLRAAHTAGLSEIPALVRDLAEYDAADEFPKTAKELFGLDLKPLVKAAAKAEPAPEPKPAKKAKGKAA